MIEPKIIDIKSFKDERGYLSVIEEDNHIPFEVGNSYWINSASPNDGHQRPEYLDKSKLIVALSGEINVIVDNGIEIREFSLNRAYYGLLIPNGYNYKIMNCTSNSITYVIISK